MGFNFVQYIASYLKFYPRRKNKYVWMYIYFCVDIKEDLYDLQKIVIDNFFILRGLCVCIFIIKSQKMPHVQSGR